MLHRGDLLLFFAGIIFTVDYTFGYGSGMNFFVWAFLILAIADYAHRLWPAIKKYRDKKKAEEQERLEKLKAEKEKI